MNHAPFIKNEVISCQRRATHFAFFKTLWVLLPLLLSPLISRAGATILANSSAADWMFQVATNSTPGSSGTITQIASGGDPSGPYIQTSITAPSSGTLNCMTIYTGQSYTPQTQGAIQTITFSADLQGFTGASSVDIVFFGLYQNGIQYFVNPPPFYTLNPPGWISETLTLTPSTNPNLFTPDSGPFVGPNLVNGGPIEFGIVTSEGGALQNKTYGIDNFSIQINPVPEPASWNLALLSGVATVISFKRRKKVNP